MTVKSVSVYERRIVFVGTREHLKFVILNFHESQQHTRFINRDTFFSESVVQFSHCPKNVPKTILNMRFWNCVMFYVNKKCAKIQNTKFRIERSAFFWQWNKYIYFSADIGPLTFDIDNRYVKWQCNFFHSS